MIDLAKKYNTSKSSIFTAIHRIIPKGNSGLSGEKHLSAKLTERDVLMARNLRKDGLYYREIASRYDVSLQTIIRAINGETWKHVR